MATKLKHQQTENNVAQMPSRCTAPDCTKKADRLNFCPEHYDWFKFGLLTKEGQKPSDFDKKFMAWQKRKAA